MTGSAPAPRRRIGRFELGRRIGAGGMATVFAAREHGPMNLGRLVALKVMSAALVGDPESERMFLREAGVSARLEHRHIVRVYEVGDADGTLFISMELLHGASLDRLCKSEPPPLPVAMRLLSDIAKALHFAHELRDADGSALGLVHQDVTPHNVMVSYDGVTKLLDFGVARLGSIDASRTETIRGKPAYLAPEQVLGERIDRRTDVFALGAIAYELLTAKRLFAGGSQLDIYAAITTKPIPQASEHDVPPAIAAIVDRATSRDPQERFTDVAAFSSALEEACATLTVERVDEEALATWARGLAPPRYSLIELEREITRGVQGDGGATSVATEEATELTQRKDKESHTTKETITETPSAEVPMHSETRLKASIEAPPSSVRYLLVSLIAVLLGIVGSQLWNQHGSSTTPPKGSSSTASVSAATPPPSLVPPRPRQTSSATQVSTTTSVSAATPRPLVSARHQRAPTPSKTASAAPTTSATETIPTTTATSPPAPTTTSVPKTAKSGTIAVRSSPWGAVFLNGVPVGNSPQVLKVKPGSHTVVVRTESGQRKQRTVIVRPGKTSVVQLVF